MADATEIEDAAKPKGRGKLVIGIAAIGIAGAAFAVTYLGLISFPTSKKSEHFVEAPTVSFVDVPRLSVPIDGGKTTLILSVKIDTSPDKSDQVAHLMPRISDNFNDFLADIATEALQRRGVLEILRQELKLRAQFVLGETVVNDILITEFAVR